MTIDLKGVSDADLLTLSGLLSALLTLAQRDAIPVPPAITLRGFGQACVSALQERELLQDSTSVRVIVLAGGQITEWTDGQPFTRDNNEDLLS